MYVFYLMIYLCRFFLMIKSMLISFLSNWEIKISVTKHILYHGMYHIHIYCFLADQFKILNSNRWEIYISNCTFLSKKNAIQYFHNPICESVICLVEGTVFQWLRLAYSAPDWVTAHTSTEDGIMPTRVVGPRLWVLPRWRTKRHHLRKREY